MKLACVIQGNIRRGFDEVLPAITRLFPNVIVSTWKAEASKLPAGRYEAVLSDPPSSSGVGNRYFQRTGMAAGLAAARRLGCTHILRWRTDLLPTRLDPQELLRRSERDVPKGLTSRIVLSAWRNLSVEPDWFSSLPDLFMFSDVVAMERLWGLGGIDISKPVNFPPEMVKELGITWDAELNRLTHEGKEYALNQVFDNHIEFYAWFRSRLQRDLCCKLDHPAIALSALSLIDHRCLGICWFKDSQKLKFRPILNAVNFSWWTEKNWRLGVPQKRQELGWPLRRPLLAWNFWNRLLCYREICFQRRKYSAYRAVTQA